MDYGAIMNNTSTIMLILAALVFSVNIIVEVIKKVFAKIPTSLLAMIVSLVVTMVAFLAWAGFTSFAVMWYHIAGVLILGLFVAYAAMFGFDKFKQAFAKLKNYK